MDIVKSIEHEQLKNKVPSLKVGDTVRVHQRIKEGNRERIQVFEGIIIKIQGGGVNQTFTVRRISYGVGVEKTFLVHSPLMEKVELVRVGKARRAKLFYLRDRVGKSAKTREQIGARIENKEIVLKEEIVVPETEEVPEVTEEVVAEAVAAETVAPETTEEVKEEVPVEAAPEEAPAVETAEPVKEEVVDTVKEEAVEEVKEEPVAEEAKVEETTEEATKAEEPAQEEVKTEETPAEEENK